MAPTIEQEGAVAEFEAKAGDQVTPFDQYTQELKETFGEDVANQLRLDDIRNQPETRATAQILQANAKANNVRLSNTEAFDIAAKQIAARRLGDFFQGRSELAAAAPEVGTKGGRGIPGEKAAVETIAGQQRQAFQPGQDATLLTRQKPPQVSYKIDPKSGRVVSRKVAPTEQYMYGETAPSLSDTIKTERALSRVEKYLPEFVDMEKQGMFDDIPDAMKADLQILMDNAGVKTVGELVSDINFRKQVGKSTTVESQYIPDRILPATERLRANLINRFSNRAVTEGYLQNQLPVEIADQVVAVAVDIMQENSQALINSPLILKKLVQVLQDKYGINKVTATNLVEAIKADSKLRTPTVQVELPDGSIIDPVAMETNLAEAYKQIVDENPKLRLQVLEQVREEVTRKVEKLVFQETIRESARQQTLRPVGEDPVADLATKTVDDLRASKKGTGDPTSGIKPVIVCDERVFQETINQLRTSGTAISDTAADILSRYEDPQPQLVEAGIVPKGAKVSAGFNESMGSLVQATRQFGWAEKLFGDYKRNLTSRNLLSGVNNLTSNILLETMYYGDPTVVYEIANPKSSMRQMYTRFMQNAPKDAAEAITFQAMKETGIVDTNMLATELDMVDEAGLVAKAAGKLPVVGEGARKIFTKFDKAQDNFYRWGDSFFKVRSMLTEMNRAKGILERLPVGQKARFNTGIGREIIIDKLNDSQFGMVDANGNTVPLTPEQLEGILARGGARIAAEKFVDYGKRPLYLQRLEDLRYGPLGGPLITPFLTWQYKMMDGAMPYVRMGGEQVGVSKGARAGLPFGGRLVFKPGIGSSFADVGLIDTTTDLKTNMSIAGDAFMLAARRAQIFGAAENISQGEEDLVRKGASFSGKGMDPVLVYANQSDPRIIYGKNFSQLNFLNPTLMVADAVQTIGEQALPKLQKDTHPALRKYVERRNSGQDISTADILSLAGYGGSTLADAYDRIQEASQYGNSAVLKDLAVQYGTTIALGTYGNMLKTGLRSMDADKGAGRKPVDTEVKLDAFSQMVRDTLGFGYKEAYMWGSLKSKNPAEYLDKAYQEYQEALYKNLVQEFVTKFTAAKERGASPAELAQIRSDQQAALDEYKKIATEIGQNYKSIVMKQKGEQPPKGIPKPQVFPKMNRVLRTEPIPVQHRKTYNVNELESIPEPTAPTQTVP
jgi:hypothetical protein